MATARFFDLPVYRISREKYYAERDAHADAIQFQTGSPNEGKLRKFAMDNPGSGIAWRHHLDLAYGGCWEFNEIIGYIRLHFLGSQVRGEYFAVSKKRIVRTRTKTLEFRTHKLAPEVEIEQPYGTQEVLAAIDHYIAACRRELKGRVIETSNFDALAKHVNWGAVLKDSR